MNIPFMRCEVLTEVVNGLLGVTYPEYTKILTPSFLFQHFTTLYILSGLLTCFISSREVIILKSIPSLEGQEHPFVG
jgi:hypothetical protein